MEYIRGIENFIKDKPCGVTIGKFDALHKGHRLLVQNVVAKKKEGYKAVVIVFSESPRVVLNKDDNQKFIITKDERNTLLDELGVDIILELRFDKELIETKPEAFIAMLQDKLNMRYLCVGRDFRFGYKGLGDITLINKLKEELNFGFCPVDKLEYNGDIISSTLIRKNIVEGKIKEANEMLGYEFFMKQSVAFGNKIGRTIGFPTINLIPQVEKISPPFGVYITKTRVMDKEYFGMTNIGIRPTIDDDNKITVETHLFDFNDDIYEKEVVVTFLDFVRFETKFPNIESLKEQIKTDEKNIRKMLINY